MTAAYIVSIVSEVLVILGAIIFLAPGEKIERTKVTLPVLQRAQRAADRN